jgi:hypothetical protein
MIISNCKFINIVWIDRGIILTIIFYILKYYDKIKNKKIIINIKFYRKIIKELFPELKIKKYEKHEDNNFYFNIRHIIKHQDIIIDYLNNYNDYINTNNIYLVPWFDFNDILIAYKYKENNKIKIDKYNKYFYNIFKCKRSNYNNNLWDTYIENEILNRYVIIKRINIYRLKLYLDNYLSNYTKINNNNIYYIENNEKKYIDNNEIDKFIKVFNEKINLLNKLI